MKKTCYLMLAALAIAGCAKQEFSLPEDRGVEVVATEGEDGELILSSLWASFPQEETRTEYTIDRENSVMKAAWSVGDYIWLSKGGTNGNWLYADEVSEDGHRAHFVPYQGATITVNANQNYLFMFPYSYYTSSRRNVWCSEQHGLFDELADYDYLTAVVKMNADKTVPDIQFQRNSSFLEIKDIDFGTGDDLRFKEIRLSGYSFAVSASLVNTVNNARIGVLQYFHDQPINIVPEVADEPFTATGGKLDTPVYIAFLVPDNTEAGMANTVSFITEDNEIYQVNWKSASAYKKGNMYSLSGKKAVRNDEIIQFKDPVVKALMTGSGGGVVYGGIWDIDGDGEITKAEAALVTNLGFKFAETPIETFDEFQYFTGVTDFNGDMASGFSGGFYGCKQLRSITLPPTLKEIRVNSFYNCESLESITVPESCTTILNQAFENCTSLKTVILNNRIDNMGTMVFRGCTSLETVQWPQNLKEIPAQTFENSGIGVFTIPLGTTTIGNQAFNNCTNITTLTLPNTVTTVGTKAFAGLTNLKNFRIQEGSAFSVDENTTMLLKNGGTEAVCLFGNEENIVIPDGVTTIPANFANGNTLIKSVYIPAVTSMGNGAFSNCTSLVRAEYDPAAKVTGKSTFAGCFALKEVILPNVEVLQQYLFQNCKALESVTLPANIKTLEMGVFQGCSAMKTVVIPEGMTEIPYYLFDGCESIETVVIPSSVNKIGQYVFRNCKNLRHIELPDDLPWIQSYLFYGCESLTEIELPSATNRIDRYAFAYTGISSIEWPATVSKIEEGVFRGCKNIKEFTIPSHVNSIGNYAFAETGISALALPSSLTTIPTGLFYGCENLTSYTVPENVTTINASAFSNCANLKTLVLPSGLTKLNVICNNSGIESLVIPDGVTEIPTSCFENCKKLKTIKFPANLKKLNTWSLKGCEALECLVFPASTNNLGMSLIDGCTKLQESGYAVFEGTTPPSIMYNSLGREADGFTFPIYVPDAAMEAYETANTWKSYYINRLKPMSELNN